MKAVVCEKYGPPEVLRLKDIEKPQPKPNEVLIKIHATTATTGDCRVRGLNVPFGFGFIVRLLFGFSAPRQPILGTELAGTIESIGERVTRFKVGDPVFAATDFAMGCYAEYKCLPESAAITLKPANLDFAEAASLPFGGITALNFLRRAKLKAGERVLINGASGAVGIAAVQIAKYMGAHVTGVCSTANIALVKSIGADHVIDYTKEDFAHGTATYDVMMDTVGNAPFSRCKAVLKNEGRHLMVHADILDMLQIPWVSLTSRKKIIAGSAASSANDLRLLAEWVSTKGYQSVIDRCYAFDQIAEAHRYVETGRKRGNVVINVMSVV